MLFSPLSNLEYPLDVQSLRFCRIAFGRADERQLPERQFLYAVETELATGAVDRDDSA